MKVLIIGAGVSGITTASTLLHNNFKDFIILEAENRIGGRIFTTNFGNSIVDLGAQWCHGSAQNIVYNLAGESSFHETKMDYTKMTFSNGNEINADICSKLMKTCDEILESTKLIKSNESVENFLRRNYTLRLAGWSVDESLSVDVLNNFLYRECSFCGCESLKNISIDNFNKFKECAGSVWLNWKGKGYSSIFNFVAKESFDEIKSKILLNKKVVNIDYSRDVTVKCSDGSKYRADFAVVTVPLGVLKSTYSSLFTPSLSNSKIQAINDLSFGAVGKIFLEFDRQFWPNDWVGLTLLWNDENRAKIKGENAWLDGIYCIYTVDFAPRILLARVSGEKVAEIENLSFERIQSGCDFLFEQFLPKGVSRERIIDVKTPSGKQMRIFSERTVITV